MIYEFNKQGNLRAFTIVEDFFDYYGPDKALHYTERMIYYAVHCKYYRDLEPNAMLFHAAWLQRMTVAVFILERSFRHSNGFMVAANEKGMPALGRPADFMPGRPGQEWKYFPRHITAAQYLNPVEALQEMTGYKRPQQWKKIIGELLEYSLCRASINGCYPPRNVMKLRWILLRAIEACYLLLLRNKQYMNPGASLIASLH